MTTAPKASRIEVVDALRGFAVMAIMLLHNIEHFDLYYFPESLPAWIKATDGYIWTSLFFLFSGKTYTIFALLFGFSFFIMDNNQRLKGYDFRGRFLWRMFILLGFGLVNSLLFEGDILTYYAVLGCTLVLVNRLSNKAVLMIAVLLLLQPVEWVKMVGYWINPTRLPMPNLSDQYFGNLFGYMSGNSIWELIKGNFTNGRLGVFFWSWENGRLFQTPALFMIGMLIGRLSYFIPSPQANRFWKQVLIVASISATLLFIVKIFLPDIIQNPGMKSSMGLIVSSIYNLAFTFVIVSAFVLVYQTQVINRLFKPLSVFGKMSLTNYLVQSVMGALIYYGFALGMYQYTGATFSLFIGIALFVLQLYFCKWWLRHHQQGPLEYIWHKATWVGRKS